MANVNFKFDADTSKVERAIKRLGTEFEKVVNTGNNIDQTLLDFGALVDKNANKVENLKNEMQKLNAVNIQNIASQFDKINAGGFNELIQGLRNVQSGVIGTENSIETLISKLGLSKNSLQQVSVQMRQALGNMSLGSEEYKTTLSQINLLEQAMSRIDQNVTAGASNTYAANQAKIASTQGYASILHQSVLQVQQSNAIIESNTLNSVHMAGGYIVEFRTKMLDAIHDVRANIKTLIDYNYVPEFQNSLSKLSDSKLVGSDFVQSLQNETSVKSPAFIEYIKIKIGDLVNDLDEGKIKWSEFVSYIKNFQVSGIAGINDIKQAIGSARLEMQNKEYIGKLDNFFDPDKLNKSASNIMDFAMKVGDASELTQRTLAELKGKSELEIQAISNTLQKLKQAVPIDSQAYKAATTQIGIINMEMQKTARANQAMSGGTTSATMAVQQLGFAVGDAGQLMNNWRGALMGISNNIPFVIQYMMEMNTAAKVAGTSGFKAFTTALTGPAGILLGINAVMFAMQVMPEVITLIGKASASTASQMKKLTKEIKEVTYASQGEVATAVKQKAQFQALIPVIEKTTAKTKDRKAVEMEMEKLLPKNIDLTDIYTMSQSDLKKELAKINLELEKNVANTVKVAIANAIATEIAKMTVENMKLSQMWGENSANAGLWNTLAHAGKGGSQAVFGGSLLTDIVTGLAGGQDFNNAIKTIAKNQKSIDVLYKELSKVTSGIDFSQKTFKDDRKDPKDPKDKKEDEYTELEKLNDVWDKIIAQETDADKLAGLRYAKAVAIWDLSKKVLKTEEERNKAEIAFINAGNDYNNSVLEKRKRKSEERFKDVAKEYDLQVKQQKEDEQWEEDYIKRRVETAEKLKSLVERTALEGLSDMDGLNLDEKKELYDVEIDEFGEKEARKTEIQKFYAKKRLKIEKDNFRAQLSAVGDFLGATAGLFMKNTLAYKGLAVAQATMDTWKAANIALASPLGAPWNYIEMATAIATGIGNVANIVDTQVTGYAVGGLITKPTMALMGEAGAEIVAPVRDFKSYSRELIQSAYGGRGNELSVTVKGNDLVFMLQKATKKVNRQKIGGKV